ncbi:MAG: Type 1 glutamine amidotransferase-like domain-containing protein [Thermoanaerobaculia bacterium]
MAAIKPIFLLADSQLLFWTDEEGRRFMDRAWTLIEEDAAGRPARAAYLGASNGDAPEFYDLFVSAMAEIGIRECRHVPAKPGPEDLAFLDQADLILLAGGDVWLGWTAFEETGVKDKIAQRYYAGAVLVGVSAGAVQLGLKGWDEEDSTTFDALRLVPFVVDVHDEPQWPRLQAIVPKLGEHGRGFGIPSGAGALYHADYSVEPVRHPLTEVEVTEDGLRQSVLLPGQNAEVEDSAGRQPRVVSQEELVENVLRELGGPDPDDVVN